MSTASEFAFPVEPCYACCEDIFEGKGEGSFKIAEKQFYESHGSI
ncbi:MAG: hypothetical protein WA755_11915 [Candidatus Acidiferrales bacterium]